MSNQPVCGVPHFMFVLVGSLTSSVKDVARQTSPTLTLFLAVPPGRTMVTTGRPSSPSFITNPVLLVPMWQSMETANTGPPSGYLAMSADSSILPARTVRAPRVEVRTATFGVEVTRAPTKDEEAIVAAILFRYSLRLEGRRKVRGVACGDIEGGTEAQRS